MSLAWRPGSIHHKAGSSLEAQVAPSGRTSVPLKSHTYMSFKALSTNSSLFELKSKFYTKQHIIPVWDIPATAWGSE